VAEADAQSLRAPDESLVTLTHVVYALHALSILIGVASAAFIVTAFVFGIPSIVAVIINYLRRRDAEGTFLASHFRWQIRTFWWTALWVGCSLLLALTIVGIPIAWLLVVGTGLWVVYRVARGWLALRDRQPVGM
jgi:uncharacterized membrane protein